MIDVKTVLSGISIVEVVKRSGVELKHNKACCPFHQEKTPSFSVHPQKKIFKCFGCGISGDIIEYIKQFYSTDFKGALKWLSNNFNLGLSITDSINERQENKEQLIAQGIDNIVNKIYVQRFNIVEKALMTYYRKLHQIIVSFIPPHEMALCDFPNEYIKALNDVDRIGYYCDMMMSGSFEDKKEIMEIEEVKQIEQEYSAKQ